jgi:hypothetical protein
MTLEPRVFYRAPGVYCIGPLGCFNHGDPVVVEGRQCVIRSIEPDSAGVACEEGHDPVRFPCQSLVTQTPLQRKQMTNQILVNRARYGLSAVDPRAAA